MTFKMKARPSKPTRQILKWEGKVETIDLKKEIFNSEVFSRIEKFITANKVLERLEPRYASAQIQVYAQLPVYEEEEVFKKRKEDYLLKKKKWDEWAKNHSKEIEQLEAEREEKAKARRRARLKALEVQKRKIEQRMSKIKGDV